MIGRRKFIMSLGAALLSGALAACQTSSPALPPGQALGSVKVDVTALIASGWGPQADLVRTTIEHELRASLAGRIRPGAPVLVVKVKSILTPSYVGGGGSGGGGRRWGGDGGGGTDYMESEALVIGRGGAIVGSAPVLSALPSAAGGPWYLPDIDTRRLVGLAKHNAAWIARYLGS